ncbi:pyridoxal phosphate-dependent aminotransferase [Pseudactinotalea sp. Z1739]|uniref:pyridoxal phosphate-dependent aminotransferase n=1 Tax=Pseudactinotalea sp. Z1739 TaxID=3413028 RepID=UPI003C7B1A17
MRASTRSAVPSFQVMMLLDQVARLRAQGRDVINLCAGEPSGGALQAVREHAAVSPQDFGYTSPMGLQELRRAIAGHYRRWYGMEVDAEQVVVTTGSSGAFMLTFLAAFDPGDVVVLVRPGYPAYGNILRVLGCDVVDLDCGPEVGFQPTTQMLDDVLAAHGRIDGLMLASPANPTGTMIDRERLTALDAWCSTNDVRLISDEIYHGITYSGAGGPDAHGVCAWDVSPQPTSVVISSFSKYWGMTGWRLGWALVPPDLLDAVAGLAGNVALCPPAPAQAAAFGAFSDAAYAEAEARVAKMSRSREALLSELPRLGWGPVAPADGAFYLWAGLAEGMGRYTSSVDWCAQLLETDGVAITPGVDFDRENGDQFVRLSFAGEPEELTAAVRRIERFQNR